jgi:hypothetical protein
MLKCKLVFLRLREEVEVEDRVWCVLMVAVENDGSSPLVVGTSIRFGPNMSHCDVFV